MRAEVDGSGNVTGSWRYRAYGEIAQSSGQSTPTILGYAGQLLDPSGLYYMRARWYDAGNGRFLSRDAELGDKEIPTTLNSFLYAGASPTAAWDPAGLSIDPLESPACMCVRIDPDPRPDDDVVVPAKCQLLPSSCVRRVSRTTVVEVEDESDTRTSIAVIRGPFGSAFAGFELNSNAKKKRVRLDLSEDDQNMTVDDFVAKYLKASVRRRLGGEFLQRTVREALESGNSTVRKLLIRGDYRK